ncbi:hypothetical protein [Azospirillum sp. sgz301742]
MSAATAIGPVGKGDEKTPILPVPADAPPLRFKHPKYGEPSRTWPYHNAYGRLLGYAARFDFTTDNGTPGKDVLPICYCDLGDGRRGWRSRGIPGPRPLYKLPDLMARPDTLVIVTEGEKASDAAADLFPELVTTTPMHGAKSPHKTDWTPLAGRKVVIWPDHDEAGAAFAAEVARLATEAGAASVAVVQLPYDWPRAWDVADPLPDAVTTADLRVMVETAKPWQTASAQDSGGMAPPPVTGGFMLRPNGLFFRDPDPEKDDLLLSGPF